MHLTQCYIWYQSLTEGVFTESLLLHAFFLLNAKDLVSATVSAREHFHEEKEKYSLVQS